MRASESSSTVNGSRNAWQEPGPAAYDFRSDVVTTPTSSMLAAIANASLLDDVFQEDPTTADLEAHVAALAGHPAGLLVLSGTMGNQLALRTHLTQPPHSVLCDARAHILEWEAGGVASLSGALVRGVTPRNGHHLTLEDVERHISLSDDVHACPTAVISLENTLGGAIMPLAEVARISAFAREHNVRLHLDGARLWHAAVAGAGSLSDYASLCDSVSLCFSKGLGAPIGSALVASAAFIKRARWLRKALGGGLRQAGVVAAAARASISDSFGSGPWGEGGQLVRTHETATRLGATWQRLGGSLQYPVETNMVWLDLAASGVSEDAFVDSGRKAGVRVMGGRVVLHYQISDEAVVKLEQAMEELLRDQGGQRTAEAQGKVGWKVYGT
ncbi:MAG: hypothetical protein M1832_001303 [Thelocarpon impressellum]|nr:MAG: hypothetical protein M1832_001303 [Thelocarpon impressellum]